MGGLPEAGTAGGSLQLGELIDEHGEALLFDLRHYCRIDLYEVIRGRYAPRYVLWLVGQFPPDSALSASVRGGADYRAWTPQLYLQAAQVNILAAANRQRAGKRGFKPVVQPPKSQRRSKPRVLSVAEIAQRQARAQNN